MALLFTGHMIDAPDRGKARFPASLEKKAGRAIYDYIKEVKELTQGDVVGISSGACGGDILFIEACQNLGVENFLYLPFSSDEFIKSSVRIPDSGDWENRFLSIWNSLDDRHKEIIKTNTDLNLYDACNLHMLKIAGELGKDICLMALWDGVAPEQPGGTADFVRQVKEQNGQIHQIAPDQL